MHLLLARANLSMGPVLLAAQNLSMFLLAIFTLSLAAKNYLSTFLLASLQMCQKAEKIF